MSKLIILSRSQSVWRRYNCSGTNILGQLSAGYVQVYGRGIKQEPFSSTPPVENPVVDRVSPILHP